jgi:glycosyltransferase involved in cell wall biosynthesis
LVTNEQNLGFIRSCNRGAAAARGHFLAFLNNDTQILPGWLNALVETFDIKCDAGLVGSKLIYPNGSLQEAGGIVWRDGSAWNYGRHDDPGRPEYNYLRAADYCSGASILLRRQIFEELGGFDEHYLPAYYEDTDLAFRLRQKGLQVYYQPLSCVVHFEGITSGVETAQSSNIKRFQLVNHQKFIERWRPCLSHHRANGDEPELEKERNVARRLLVVDEYMVVPDKESGSLRMFNMLQILSALGYKVTFAPLNLESRQPYLGQLQKRGIECLYTPFVRSVDAHLQEKGRLYDVVILSRANVAHEILKSVRSNCPGARVVFDTVDLHFLREEREASLFEDRQLKVMARKRRQQELAIIRESDLTFVVSAVEKRLIEREAPGKDVHIVSNIHEIHGRQAGFRERRGILFVGSFNHPPNADGVSYFVSEIFPLVKKAIPDIVFYVIGDTPPRKVASLANEHVKIMGYVADLIPFFEKCRLSVAPLRFGAGVKGKVSMSLSLGVPVIGTSVALEGMFLEHGRSAMMADDAELFAKCIVDVYSDEELWNCLSNNGLKVLQENFSFDAAKRALRDALCVSS